MGRTRGMREYWDAAARKNAAYYVDTDLSFGNPDMERFWTTGRTIADEAMSGPAVPSRRELAVEIGSGLGRIVRALVEAHGFERAVGVDIAPEMVRQARELVNDERVTFEVGAGASLAPVEDGVADLVVSFTVFQHIPDVSVIEAYIAEAGRVLRSGGVFAFQWNNIPGHRRWAIKRTVLSTLQRTGIRRERFERNAAQFLGSRVPLSRIQRALTGAGLRLAGTRDDGTLFTWAWATKP